jgi:hypothetical protein
MPEFISFPKKTDDPNRPRRAACSIINDEPKGLGMPELEEIVRKYIPTVENEEVNVHKDILWTQRYECPCCPTAIRAVVLVYTTGLGTSEGRAIEGFYFVTIDQKLVDDKVLHLAIVQKLEKGEVLAQVEVPYLPRKDHSKELDYWKPDGKTIWKPPLEE